MNTITISLSSIENQLCQFNSRLSLIEECLCNMFDVASTSRLHSVHHPLPFLLNNFPHTLPTGEVLITPDKIQMPPSSRRNPHHHIHFPINFQSPTRYSKESKKIGVNTRGQYVRGCMDALFTPSEMATSNLGGKRKKEKKDEARVDLVKRKLKLLALLFILVHISQDESKPHDASYPNL